MLISHFQSGQARSRRASSSSGDSQPAPSDVEEGSSEPSPAHLTIVVCASSVAPLHYLITLCQSEDGKRRWKELPSVFAEDSQLFANLVDYDLSDMPKANDPITHLPGLERVGKLSYSLVGVTPFDLDALLQGLKPKYVIM